MIKTKTLLSLAFAFLVISCGSNKSEEVEQLKDKIKSLEKEKKEDQASLDNFANLANELNASLEKITAEQQAIVNEIKEDPEVFKSPEMKSKIATLTESLGENKSTLENFKSNLSEANNSEEVVTMLNTVVKDIEDKTESIELLQDQLNAVDVAFDDLFFKFSETLSELDDAKSDLNKAQNTLNETAEDLEKTQQYLNTVWYVIDSYGNLEDHEIIEKEGGVMGLGAKRTIKPNLNVSFFTKGDKNSLKKIKISTDTRKLEFITKHPEDSYHIENKVLIIDNPNDFWSLSKYLVIGIK